MIAFLLKLTIYWGLLALFYSLMLKRETFFRANRAYLLGTSALGILLALPVAWPLFWQSDSASWSAVLPAVTIGLQQAEEATQTCYWLDYLWIAYWAGAGLALLRMLWGLVRIIRMRIRSNAERLADGCVLVKTAETDIPFSFFKWVFVPTTSSVLEEGRGKNSQTNVETGKATAEHSFSTLASSERGYAMEAMLAHERAHAHDWHSLDVLLVELLCIAFWFHPLAHWYRRALRSVHEYLADAEASRLIDKKQYGLLLIRQAQSGVQLAFVNHFLQSPLKQRLMMLTQNASPALRVWKYGLVLPVFTLLFLFACQKTTPEEADLKTAAGAAISVQTPVDKNVSELFEVEQPPQFFGGQAALIKYLSENITYPEAARRESAEGVVAVVFVVDGNGAVTDVTGIKSEQNGWRQDFQDEAVRVVKSMPNWEPAVSRGKPVKVRFTLPIRFKLR